MSWMLMPLRRYFDFRGRSQRMEWWMFTLFYFLVMAAFTLILAADFPWAEIFADMTNPSPAAEGNEDVSGWEPGALFWTGVGGLSLFYLVTIIPSISVSVRRLHDQNLSGWLVLLYFIPYIGWIIIWIFACIEGTRGPNRYGEDPKDMHSTRAFE